MLPSQNLTVEGSLVNASKNPRVSSRELERGYESDQHMLI